MIPCAACCVHSPAPNGPTLTICLTRISCLLINAIINSEVSRLQHFCLKNRANDPVPWNEPPSFKIFRKLLKTLVLRRWLSYLNWFDENLSHPFCQCLLSEYLTQKPLFSPCLLITKKLNYQLNPLNDEQSQLNLYCYWTLPWHSTSVTQSSCSPNCPLFKLEREVGAYHEPGDVLLSDEVQNQVVGAPRRSPVLRSRGPGYRGSSFRSWPLGQPRPPPPACGDRGREGGCCTSGRSSLRDHTQSHTQSCTQGRGRARTPQCRSRDISKMVIIYPLL